MRRRWFRDLVSENGVSLPEVSNVNEMEEIRTAECKMVNIYAFSSLHFMIKIIGTGKHLERVCSPCESIEVAISLSAF